MLDGCPHTFKICWVYQSHALNSIKNLKNKILWSRPQSREFSQVHYDQAHEQSKKTIKSIKGPIDFVNCGVDKLQRRWEIAGPEITKHLEQVEIKILKGTKKNDTQRHEDNSKHNAMFRKDYTTVIGRLLSVNLFLGDSIIKVGRDIAYSKEVYGFFNAILEIG